MRFLGKNGNWQDNDINIMYWSQRCYSYSPSDIMIYDSHDYKIGRTNEKKIEIGTKINLYDRHDNVVAVFEEDIINNLLEIINYVRNLSFLCTSQ